MAKSKEIVKTKKQLLMTFDKLLVALSKSFNNDTRCLIGIESYRCI